MYKLEDVCFARMLIRYTLYLGLQIHGLLLSRASPSQLYVKRLTQSQGHNPSQLYIWTVFHQNGDSGIDSVGITMHAFDGPKTVVRTSSEPQKGSHSGRMHYVALLLQNPNSGGIFSLFGGYDVFLVCFSKIDIFY